VGAKIDVESVFKVGQKVDVQGVTIGKASPALSAAITSATERLSRPTRFRTGFRLDRAEPEPARVPGKRMPGHLGDKRRTISNLIVVRVDAARQLLLVKARFPGLRGTRLRGAPGVKISKPVVSRPKPQAPKQARTRGQAEAKPAAKPAAAAAQPAPRKAEAAMELKMVGNSGTLNATDAIFGRGFNERCAPGGRRLPGECAHRLARPEGPRRGQPLDEEAVAPERHRPRAPPDDLEPAVARRRQDLPELARRELLAQGDRRMYRAGLCAILSQLARRRPPAVVDKFVVDAPKTKLLRRSEGMGSTRCCDHRRDR